MGVELSYTPDLGTYDLSGLAHMLVGITGQPGGDLDFQLPIEKEVLSICGVGDWSIMEPFQVSGIGWISPHLLGGICWGSSKRYVARSDRSDGRGTFLQLDGDRTVFAGKAGLGLEIWPQSKWGIRFATIDRLYVGAAPQYDPSIPVDSKNLYQRMQTSIDLLVQLK